MPSTTRRHWLQRAAALAAAAAAGRVPQARAAPDPSLCGSAPAPAYPPPERPAIVQSWLVDGRQDGPLPDCDGLPARDFELLVRLTASYNAPGELADQLLRFGAVSRLRGAHYWSFSDRQRQMLFKEAYAVDSPASTQPRADFSLAELRAGAELYFVHSDNRSSKLVPYGLQVVQQRPDGFRVHYENVGDIRLYGMTLVAAREMQWSVSLERLGPGRWGYRSLLGQRRLRLGRNEQHRLSNLSRSVAMFDLLAGRQTDIEPYR
jgi:hypothetical protein